MNDKLSCVLEHRVSVCLFGLFLQPCYKVLYYYVMTGAEIFRVAYVVGP